MADKPIIPGIDKKRVENVSKQQQAQEDKSPFNLVARIHQLKKRKKALEAVTDQMEGL